MAVLNQEARLVQNSALGAGMIWQVCIGYHESHRTRDFMPLLLGFLVLPLLYHRDTWEVVSSTQRRTGLRGLAEKFTASNIGKSDVLLAIHDRALKWRALSWNSITIAVETRLTTLDTHNATIVPLTTSKVRGVPSTVQGYLTNASKLGGWFAELSLYEISNAIGVVF